MPPLSGLYHCEGAAAADELGWEGAAAEAGAEAPRTQDARGACAAGDGAPIEGQHRADDGHGLTLALHVACSDRIRVTPDTCSAEMRCGRRIVRPRPRTTPPPASALPLLLAPPPDPGTDPG